ncbi:MAG: SCO family protein [Pseudomonadota bacterium]
MWLLPLVALIFIVALFGFWMSNTNQPLGGVGNANGTLGGEFELTGHQGPVRLSDFDDKVVVIYFGFLGCTNYCDISMHTLKSAFNRLPDSNREYVQALMINIDPWLEDIDELERYTQSWHPQISGLIGSLEQIKSVTQQYGAFFERTSGGESAADEATDYLHTSRFFIVNKQGALVDAMRHSTTPAELAARLTLILDESDDQG